jgi:hypothetical protein
MWKAPGVYCREFFILLQRLLMSRPLLLPMEILIKKLYGPRHTVYHAIPDALQVFGGITEEIRNAFPGNLPAAFNVGGASISLPEAMGLMDKDQSPILPDVLTGFQNGCKGLPSGLNACFRSRFHFVINLEREEHLPPGV